MTTMLVFYVLLTFAFFVLFLASAGIKNDPLVKSTCHALFGAWVTYSIVLFSLAVIGPTTPNFEVCKDFAWTQVGKFQRYDGSMYYKFDFHGKTVLMNIPKAQAH